MSEKRMGLNQGGSWRTVAVTALVFATSLPQDAQAGVFVKADNSTALNVAGSWTNNAVPGASDIAQWDSNVISGAAYTLRGANLSWGSIRILNPGQICAIDGGDHKSLTLNSFGTAIDMSAATRDFTIGGAVILATNQTWDVGVGRTLTVTANSYDGDGGAIRGGFSLNKAGAGALTLIYSNTFSGVMTVSNGTLNVNGANGRLGNNSGIAVSKGANLVMGDANNALADRINDAVPVTLGGGALTFQGKNSTATTETLGALTIGAGGHSTVTVTPGSSSTATLTLANLSRSGTGGTVTIGNTGTIATSPALNNGILGGWAVWGGSTSGQRGNAVTVSGGNLAYLNTFDKTYTAITNNISDWTSSQNIYFNPTGATLTAMLGADLSANSLTFLDVNCNPTLDLGGKTLSLTSGGMFYPSQNNNKGYTIRNGTLTAGTGTAPAELFITSANYNYTFHSIISATISDNSGYAVSVVQPVNPGASMNNVLSGNNSYSGGTYINAGYIYIFNDNNLGAVDGAVYFQGGSLGIWADMTLNASRNLVAAANATASIDTFRRYIDVGGRICTIAGKVTGAGNFEKTGTNPTLKLDTGAIAGTVILTNPGNDWAGTTTISAGILQIGDGITTAGSLPDRAVALSGANTTLKFANPTAVNFNSLISGYGDLIKTGAGTLTLGGVNTYSNGTTISGGTLAVASDAALGAAYDGSVSGATVTNANNTSSGISLTFSAPPSGTTATGTIDIYYVINNNNNLLKVSNLAGGSGYVAPPTVTVNGANGGGLQAYVKGLLTLDGGTLQTTAGIMSSRAVYLTSNNGTIDTAGNNSTFSGVFNGPGCLTKTGAGTLALNGINSYTGATTVNGGALGGTGTVAGVVTNLAAITAADTNSMGTLTVANLVMAENSTYIWNYNGSTQDLIKVTGTLTLPTVATVNVSQVISGTLPDPAVLMTFGDLSGARVLREWIVVGAPGSVIQVDASNNRLLLAKIKGTMISIF